MLNNTKTARPILRKAAQFTILDHIGLLHLYHSQNGCNEAENAADDRKCKRPVEITIFMFCTKNDDTEQHEQHYKQAS